jgi:hypothetical protein
MGAFLADNTALDLISQLNNRFGTGEAITELTALHKEFQIFTSGHQLKTMCAVVGIRPFDPGERRRWHTFLDRLKTYSSDRPNVNGHDRIQAAYVENFQATDPLPMFTQCHLAKDDPRVVVTTGNPIVFSPDPHVIISVPITPVGQQPGAGQAGTGSP